MYPEMKHRANSLKSKKLAKIDGELFRLNAESKCQY